MRNIPRDARYALRTLLKTPVLALAAVLTLAIGIGANTAIFSLVHALILEAMPVRAPEELYWLSRTLGSNEMSISGGERVDFTTYHGRGVYEALTERDSPFADAAAVANLSAAFRDRGDPLQVSVQAVTASFFDMLSVRAFQGRLIENADDEPGAATAVVLRHELWRGALGGDPDVVGREVSLAGGAATIVGVAPPGFRGMSAESVPDLWIPLAVVSRIDPRRAEPSPHSFWLRQLVRLPDGASLEQAEAYSTLAVNRVRAESLGDRGDAVTAFLEPAGYGDPATHRRWKQSLTLLWAAAGLLLLIGCLNVANLLLARAADRRKEMGVRLALGASRSSLAWQFLLEALLLSVAGAAIGAPLAGLLTEAALRLSPNGEGLQVETSAAVFGFAVLAACIAASICAIAPAWSVSGAAPGVASSARSEARGAVRVRGAFVAAQTALCLPVLAAGALLLRSLDNLYAVDPGLEPESLIMASLNPASTGMDPQRVPGMYEQLLERLEEQPGVRSAAIGNAGALSGSSSWSTIQPVDAGPDFPRFIAHAAVSERYFETLGMTILAGRSFSDADMADAARVAVVNRAYAKLAFGDRDPIGQGLRSSTNRPADTTVVGLVTDAKYQALREDPPPVVFFSHRQERRDSMRVYLKADTGAAAAASILREQARSVAPSVPLTGVRTLEEQIARTLRRERLLSTLLTGFGIAGLLLTAVGLFGVTAYGVSRRTREVGLRMALGATGSGIRKLIVAGSLRWVCAGLALGAALAYPAGRLLESLLYGVTTYDLAALGASGAILLVSALGAAYLPAVRAARLQPTEALRQD